LVLVRGESRCGERALEQEQVGRSRAQCIVLLARRQTVTHPDFGEVAAAVAELQIPRGIDRRPIVTGPSLTKSFINRELRGIEPGVKVSADSHTAYYRVGPGLVWLSPSGADLQTTGRARTSCSLAACLERPETTRASTGLMPAVAMLLKRVRISALPTARTIFGISRSQRAKKCHFPAVAVDLWRTRAAGGLSGVIDTFCHRREYRNKTREKAEHQYPNKLIVESCSDQKCGCGQQSERGHKSQPKQDDAPERVQLGQCDGRRAAEACHCEVHWFVCR
jgi:hypothetical protein